MELTTGSQSNVGVVECSSTVESPLGEGDIVLIPHFNVATLGDEVVLELSLGSALLMLVFTRESVPMCCKGGRDERKDE